MIFLNPFLLNFFSKFFCNFFFHVYKNLTAKYYQENKEKLQEKARERYQNLSNRSKMKKATIWSWKLEKSFRRWKAKKQKFVKYRKRYYRMRKKCFIIIIRNLKRLAEEGEAQFNPPPPAPSPSPFFTADFLKMCFLERVKPWFFVTSNFIISLIFPETSASRSEDMKIFSVNLLYPFNLL